MIQITLKEKVWRVVFDVPFTSDPELWARFVKGLDSSEVVYDVDEDGPEESFFITTDSGMGAGEARAIVEQAMNRTLSRDEARAYARREEDAERQRIEAMKPGTQVVYVPYHAHGDVSHEDCQAGFVTSAAQDGQVGCRFFYKDNTLRTTANSERCRAEQLVVMDTRPQEVIDVLLPMCLHQTEEVARLRARLEEYEAEWRPYPDATADAED